MIGAVFRLGSCVFVPLAHLRSVVREGNRTGAWIGGLVPVAILAALLVRRFRSDARQRNRI